MHKSVRTICAVCDNDRNFHGLNTAALDGAFSTVCDRDPDSIGSASWINERTGVEYNDYLLTEDNEVVLAYNLSGAEALSGSDLMVKRLGSYSDSGNYEDEADYVSVDIEQSKLDRWNDGTFSQTFTTLHLVDAKGHPFAKTVVSTQSWISTSLNHTETEEVRLTKHFRYEVNAAQTDYTVLTRFTKERVEADLDEQSTQQRNVYVEGNPGFLSVKLLDEVLTRKHHAKLLNVFRDKRTNEVRIGSVRITKHYDGMIQGICVNRNCNPEAPGVPGKSALVDPLTATRSQMEEFVWACVAHGNNHAASWFKNRPEFYELSSKLGPEVLTDDEQYAFLQEHATFCSDAKCECSDRMAELRPDLHVKEMQHF